MTAVWWILWSGRRISANTVALTGQITDSLTEQLGGIRTAAGPH